MSLDMEEGQERKDMFVFRAGKKDFPVKWTDLVRHSHSTLMASATWARRQGRESCDINCTSETFEVIAMFLKTNRLVVSHEWNQHQVELLRHEFQYLCLDEALVQLFLLNPQKLEGLSGPITLNPQLDEPNRRLLTDDTKSFLRQIQRKGKRGDQRQVLARSYLQGQVQEIDPRHLEDMITCRSRRDAFELNPFESRTLPPLSQEKNKASAPPLLIMKSSEEKDEEKKVQPNAPPFSSNAVITSPVVETKMLATQEGAKEDKKEPRKEEKKEVRKEERKDQKLGLESPKGMDRKSFRDSLQSVPEVENGNLVSIFDDKGWKRMASTFPRYSALCHPQCQGFNTWVSHMDEFRKNLNAYSLGILPQLELAGCKAVVAGGCVLACLKQWPTMAFPRATSALYELARQKRVNHRIPTVEQIFARQMITGSPLPNQGGFFSEPLPPPSPVEPDPDRGPLFFADNLKKRVGLRQVQSDLDQQDRDEYKLLWKEPRTIRQVTVEDEDDLALKDDKNEPAFTYVTDSDSEPDSPPATTPPPPRDNDDEDLGSLGPSEREAFALLKEMSNMKRDGQLTTRKLKEKESKERVDGNQGSLSSSSSSSSSSSAPLASAGAMENTVLVGITSSVRTIPTIDLRSIPSWRPIGRELIMINDPVIIGRTTVEQIVRARREAFGRDQKVRKQQFDFHEEQLSTYPGLSLSDQERLGLCARQSRGRLANWCDNGQLCWDTNNLRAREKKDSFSFRSWREGDIDLFLVCADAAEAEKQLLLFERVLKEHAVVTPVFSRSRFSVSAILPAPYRTSQVNLRIYSSMEHVLSGFDWDVCQVGYDLSRPDNVWATLTAFRAIHSGQMMLDLARQSDTFFADTFPNTFELRAVQYARRGFQIAIPTLLPTQADALIFHCVDAQLRKIPMNRSGIVTLLRMLLFDKPSANAHVLDAPVLEYDEDLELDKLSETIYTYVEHSMPFHSAVSNQMDNLLSSSHIWNSDPGELITFPIHVSAVPDHVKISPAVGTASFPPRHDPFWFQHL